MKPHEELVMANEEKNCECDSGFDPNVLKFVDFSPIQSFQFYKTFRLPDVTFQKVDAGGKTITYDVGIMLTYQQDWSPKGHCLGEIVHSLSLLPGEEVVLEHKTWETSKTQQDTEDETSSRNTSDTKTEASDSLEVMDEMTSSEKYSISASGGIDYGIASFEAGADYSGETTAKHNEVSKSLKAQTKQYISEVSKRRVVKISVSRESGSEEKSTRKIKNINQCHTLNANFYQICRIWKVSTKLVDISMVIIGEHSENEGDPSGTDIKIEDGDWTVDPIRKVIHFPHEKVVKIEPPEPIKREPEPIAYDRTREILALRKYSLDLKNKSAFADAIMASTEPMATYCEPDHLGMSRYTYRVIPGREAKVIKHLGNAIIDSKSYVVSNDSLQIIRGEGKEKGFSRISLFLPENFTTIAKYPSTARVDWSQGNIALMNTNHFLASSIRNVPRAKAAGTKDILKEQVVKQVVEKGEDIEEVLKKLRNELIVNGKIDDFDTAIPTNGVYAEAMTGKCCACEDYFIQQRQLDLEIKKLERQRLELENQKLQKIIEGQLPEVVPQHPIDFNVKVSKQAE